LEPYAVDFIDIAAADAALDSTVDMVGRISAFSALGSVLSVIGPSTDSSNDSSSSAAASAAPSFKRSQQYRDTHYGSSTFLQSLYLLRDRGHLKRLLLNVGLVDNKSAGAAPYDTMTGLLEATLTLCSHIASCRDGANILLEYGVLTGLNSLPVIPLPSSSSHDDHLQDFLSSTQSSAYTEDDIEVMLEPTLRLLNVLGSTSPCHEVLQQCCLFLVNNHQIISYYLHLRSLSLRGLRVILSIVSVMCLIAPATSAIQREGREEGPRGGQREEKNPFFYSSIWETEMGPKGDAYTADLCRLGRVLGSKPLPNWNYLNRTGNMSGSNTTQDNRSSWWITIKPSSPYEMQLHEEPIAPPSCLKLHGGGSSHHQSASPTQPHWTRFDGMKFIFGLRILERVGSFFRMRANLCIMTSHGLRLPAMPSSGASLSTSRHQNLFTSSHFTDEVFEVSIRSNSTGVAPLGDVIGLSAVSMDDLAFTFQSMTSFYLHVSSSFVNKEEEKSHWVMESNTLSTPFHSSLNKKRGAGGDHDSSHAGGVVMTEIDQEINKLLLCLSESLLCAIYDLLIIASPTERISWRNDVTACLQITEKFPPHSFLRQISRYLHQQINDTIKRK
jgi:hypothetical protein